MTFIWYGRVKLCELLKSKPPSQVNVLLAASVGMRGLKRPI